MDIQDENLNRFIHLIPSACTTSTGKAGKVAGGAAMQMHDRSSKAPVFLTFAPFQIFAPPVSSESFSLSAVRGAKDPRSCFDLTHGWPVIKKFGSAHLFMKEEK